MVMYMEVRAREQVVKRLAGRGLKSNLIPDVVNVMLCH